MRKYNKAIVLGGSGFIGLNLINALLKQEFKVICFSRNKIENFQDKVTYIEGDLSVFHYELLGHMDNAYVFHLISSCQPSSNLEKSSYYIQNDVLSTINYLEKTKDRNLKWVFLSSGGTVYGRNNSYKIKEDSSTNPICSYGVNKLTLENYFKLYNFQNNTDVVIARLSNPYGPFQNPQSNQGIIAKIFNKIRNKESLEIWGDGENIRDYIYIADAIDGIISLALYGIHGEIYNIGTGIGTTINQLINYLNINQELCINYSPGRQIDVFRNVLCVEKIFKHTGWKYNIDLGEGLYLTQKILENSDKIAI